MNRMLTTLLIWLLMAALPLHAVAAGVKLSCAPAQAHPEAMLAAPQAGEHAAHHAAHAAADTAHAHHAHHAEPVVAAVTAHAGHDASQAGAGTGDLSHSSCSACSVFCVGAVAPPSSSLSVPSLGGSEAVVIAPASLPAGFIPEGLQRPPRPSSI